MSDRLSLEKPELQALPQISDRMTFLYLEHCVINREDGAITATDEKGTVRIPAAGISVLMLGPGTKVTHRAVELIGNTGVSIIWVGEKGVRYYASGRPLTHSSRLLYQQAVLVTNTRSHLAVARKMYQMRFPDEDVSDLTMQQLRGKEGARVRAIYRKISRETNVEWNGREYNPDDFQAGNPINQALTAGHLCLYGLATAVITALGCSPGLGFVHVGHELSFVYDIADLYKADITIPIAFECAAKSSDDIARTVRQQVRDEMSRRQLIRTMVRDIYYLLDLEEKAPDNIDVISLWDGKNRAVSGGVNYQEGLS